VKQTLRVFWQNFMHHSSAVRIRFSYRSDGYEDWSAWLRGCGEGVGGRISEARPRGGGGYEDAQQAGGVGGEHPGARVGNFAEAAGFGELLVLAVKGHAAADVLRMAGVENLRGKPVLDATNPIAEAPPVNGVLKLFTSFDESLMEQLQREFAGAKLVKAFNSVGAALMVNPRLNGGKPTMFICGNDNVAKQVTSKIIDDFGWETADMGKAEAARAIEPLCILWCIPGFLRNDWTHAFKLLRE
jgi:predicted dinucleotide-binding enzyme